MDTLGSLGFEFSIYSRVLRVCKDSAVVISGNLLDGFYVLQSSAIINATLVSSSFVTWIFVWLLAEVYLMMASKKGSVKLE